MLKIVCAAVLAASVTIPTLGAADDAPDGGEHHWPRPQAIAACKDKSEGDVRGAPRRGLWDLSQGPKWRPGVLSPASPSAGRRELTRRRIKARATNCP